MFDAQQCLLLAGVVIVVKQLTWTLSSSASDEGKIYLFETLIFLMRAVMHIA